MKSILVAVTSECSVKRFICKTWTGTLANSADQDQMQWKLTSDQVCTVCLNYLKLRVKWNTLKSPRTGPFSQHTLRDNRPTSALSTLILAIHMSKNLGPVVQSVVSLTSSLRVISLTVLVDSRYNILIFFAEKMWVAFSKSYSHFFSKKFQHICISLNVNFSESLTNNIVSFEQLDPASSR